MNPYRVTRMIPIGIGFDIVSERTCIAECEI